MRSTLPDKDSIRGEKILVWSPKRPTISENERSPLWSNHRAYKTTLKGEGGRPVYAEVEKPWRVLDREKLKNLSNQN